MAILDFGLITDDQPLAARGEQLAKEFGYQFRRWQGVEDFMENGVECRVVLASQKNLSESETGAAEQAQAIRFICKDAFVVTTVSGKVAKESASFAKKSGADLILLEEELGSTSKLEFILTQILKASYFPIKASDLVSGAGFPFSLYHLLPSRGKFICFYSAGDPIEDERLQKCKSVGEIYIRRADVKAYNEYVANRNDRSAEGLARRCRSQFLALSSSYTDLIFLLTDQSEHSSFSEGQKLLAQCRDLCSGLISVLGAYGEASAVINNSAIGDLGSVERAPAIAAYCAVFGLQAEVPEVEEVMLAALVADLGLVLLPPGVTKKIRDEKIGEFTQAELELYRDYPNVSLKIALDRKLSLSEKFRTLVISTHERADGKGFPKGISGPKIPSGSQLIHFCRDLDCGTIVRLGRLRADPSRIRRELLEKDEGVYSVLFVTQMKKLFEGV